MYNQKKVTTSLCALVKGAEEELTDPLVILWSPVVRGRQSSRRHSS
jgi:hypothetical protein